MTDKMFTVDKLDDFTTAYIETALWSSTDNSNDSGGDPLDKNHSLYDLPEATIKCMADDCAKFQTEYKELLDVAYTLKMRVRKFDESQAGHDFWLTRNGHGAGFWDRGLGEVGDKLTEAAKKAREVSLYVGDDGFVYVS